MKKDGAHAADVMLTPLDPWSMSIETATDAQCDALLPRPVRRASSLFWTPVRVARRAAEIFGELGVTRVLDVGSGPGKFCVVAGVHAPRIAFVGVEHRPHLVAVAQKLAISARATNVSFVHGDATCMPWTGFDGFYIFNSFAENGFCTDDRFDDTVDLSPMRGLDDVMRVERWLATRAVGTVLLTYHGLGGPIPGSYECVHVERAGTAWLRAWRRGTAAVSDKYWLEDGEEVTLSTMDDVVRALSSERFAR